jgi:hypothetical protein
MANKITWSPSTEPDIARYDIENSTTSTGPWAFLTGVIHDLSGSNYESASGTFFYIDSVNPASTWYRLFAVDTGDLRSLPTVAFQVAGSDIPTFSPGGTPFGIFDNDTQFQYDADRYVDFVKKKLGDPIMTVHMSSSQIYAAFEEACLEYSAVVNSYQAKSVLSSYLGSPTGTLSGGENKYVTKNLQFSLYQADAYAAEANLNSMQSWYTGSFSTISGQQSYDLQALLSGTGGLTGSYANARVRIREVYHRSPLQAYRFFGTTSGLNYLNNQFRFESFTPETLFYLLPIWEDVLRGMQFKTSNNVRRSNYSFDIHDNNIRIFPVPSDERQIWLTYTIDTTPAPGGSGTLPSLGGYDAVSNLSNVPFGNITYSNLNSISKHWIRRMTLALSKEIEGQIRSKFTTVPIPNGDVTLNGPELIADGRAEAEYLRNELKELLEDTTYQSLMRKEQEMASYINDNLKNVPMGIYIG